MPRRLTSLFLAACALAALFSPLAPAHAAPLAVKFKNTSGLADSQVYIGFVGGEPLTATNKATNAPLPKASSAASTGTRSTRSLKASTSRRSAAASTSATARPGTSPTPATNRRR